MSTTLSVIRIAPPTRVCDVLEAGAVYAMYQDETPEQSAAAFEKKYGKPADGVFVVSNWNYVKVGDRVP
jgi:hypothetical protein